METNPKYKRPDLPETNLEIEHLKIKMNNINYCIEAVKEKRVRDEEIKKKELQ